MKKYVIVNGTFPILFPTAISHCDVFQGPGKITSAGFWRIERKDNTVKVYGHSVSLKLGPKKGDADLIERLV